jgi:phosphoglycerate dehydrogenase-like enzyme
LNKHYINQIKKIGGKCMKIFVAIQKSNSRALQFANGTDQLLESIGDVEWYDSEERMTQEYLAEKMKNVDVVITSWGTPKITAEMVNGTTVKMIGHMAGSLKGVIDRDVYNTGIKICSGNEGFGRTVAEHNLIMILMGLRRSYDFIYNMRTNKNSWSTGEQVVDGINGSTIGIVSYGTISKWLVKYLKAFECRIIVNSAYCTEEEAQKVGFEVERDLDKMIEQCDVVTILSTLTEKTFHLFDKERLAKLKDGALLVNVARGSIIDEEAMIAELESGRLFAVLDVYEKEPLPAESPLRTLSNVYTFPHVGGKTHECRSNMGKIIVEDIERLKNGQELVNAVPVEAFARMTEHIKK